MYNNGSRRQEGWERESKNSVEQRHEEICGRERDGQGRGGKKDGHYREQGLSGFYLPGTLRSCFCDEVCLWLKSLSKFTLPSTFFNVNEMGIFMEEDDILYVHFQGRAACFWLPGSKRQPGTPWRQCSSSFRKYSHPLSFVTFCCVSARI